MIRKTTGVVTGAEGYIGTFLTSFLRSHGFNIYALTSREGQFEGDQQLRRFSLSDGILTSEIPHFDFIVHLAYDFSDTSCPPQNNKNYVGTLKLFDECKRRGVTRIINMSSMSAGEFASSNYGKTKLAIEKTVWDSELYDSVLSIRPGIVHGGNTAGICGAIMNHIGKHRMIPIIANDSSKFHFCHIEDLAQLVVALISIPVFPTQTLIAAHEVGLSLKEVVRKYATAISVRPIFLPVPYELILLGLQAFELLNVKMSFRSDSLKSMKGMCLFEKHPVLTDLGVNFRPFTVESLTESGAIENSITQ